MTISTSTPELFKKLERRKQFNKVQSESLPQMETFELPKVGMNLILSRVFFWIGIFVKYNLENFIARFGKKNTHALKAKRFCQILEKKGGYTIFIGRLLASRIDLMPFEFVAELSKMSDQSSEMDINYVIEQIESVGGQPIQDIFIQFDPEPIVSDAISCVYQAILKEGDQEGDKVAVRVRRPQVEALFAADFAALKKLGTWLEIFAIVRAGYFTVILHEFHSQIINELDFRVIGRHQRIFRKYVKESRFKYANAAQIYSHLSSQNIIVNKFVSGIWYDEILVAQRNNDTATLSKLASMDIDPKIVSKRLLYTAWWSLFETMLFESAPHPSRIVIQPGNKIVFVGLVDCGSLSPRNRRLLKDVFLKLSQHDAYGAGLAMVHSLTPLPLINTQEFSKKIEQQFCAHLPKMLDKKSAWIDRTTINLWLSLFNIIHEYKVPMQLNTIRALRSLLLSDVIAGQLNHKIDVLSSFKQYQRQANRRKIINFSDQFEKQVKQGGIGSAVAASGIEMAQRIEKVGFWVDSIANQIPFDFFSAPGKASYFFSTLINFLWICGSFALFLMFVNFGVGYLENQQISIKEGFSNVLNHPLFIMLMFIVGMVMLRKVIFRLKDMDNQK